MWAGTTPCGRSTSDGAFRFPRRRVAVPGVEREIDVLPRLAPLLPVPVPTPVFVGRAGDLFPWPFFGAPLLAGAELAEAEPTARARARLGGDLGRFLRALHDVDLAVDLPDDPIRRADMPFRVERTRERLVELGDAKLDMETRDLLRTAATLPSSTDRVIAHGDLHVRHVLVDRGGTLSGVIDWGDMCRSDPAIDLMLVWSALSPEERDRFVAAYGPVGAEQRLRSRVLAIFLSATLLLYAREVANAGLERECLAGLERTLVDWD